MSRGLGCPALFLYGMSRAARLLLPPKPREKAVARTMLAHFRAHVYKDSVLAYDLDIAPVDDDVVLAEEKPEKFALAIYDECDNFGCDCIYLNVGHTAKAAPVPYVNNFLVAQIGYAAQQYRHIPTIFYARRGLYRTLALHWRRHQAANPGAKLKDKCAGNFDIGIYFGV